MNYIQGLKLHDRVKCKKDKYSNYDVGGSGMVLSGIAFKAGQEYEVVEVTLRMAYVKDPDDGCLHGITEEYFEPMI